MIQNFTSTLVEKQHLAGDVWRFAFAIPAGQQLEFKAGQYMILKLGDKRRLYSISSPDYVLDRFELTVGCIQGGVASTFLQELQIGDSAEFQGPAGHFYLRSSDKPKVMLFTGTGVAPMRSMLYSMLTRPGVAPVSAKIWALWGMPTRAQQYYSDLPVLAAEHQNLRFAYCHDCEDNLDGLDPAYCSIGRVDHVFHQWFSGEELERVVAESEFYLCARKQIVEALDSWLQGLGVPKENIYFDKFT